jgi:frataxin-like iron-binding protein CyaY
MYEPEWVVTVWRGEHFILTQLQWRKRFSKGFITALKEFIRTQEEKAYNLDESIENDVLKT